MHAQGFLTPREIDRNLDNKVGRQHARGFRQHAAQKSRDIESYIAEAKRVLAPYRKQAIQSPVLIGALQRLLKLTGRGARRFGSRLAEVRYDPNRDSWDYTAVYRI